MFWIGIHTHSTPIWRSQSRELSEYAEKSLWKNSKSSIVLRCADIWVNPTKLSTCICVCTLHMEWQLYECCSHTVRIFCGQYAVCLPPHSCVHLLTHWVCTYLTRTLFVNTFTQTLFIQTYTQTFFYANDASVNTVHVFSKIYIYAHTQSWCTYTYSLTHTIND